MLANERKQGIPKILIHDQCSLIIEWQRRDGFSLAEILIAIFVLSIGLIMIAAVFPVAAKWTAEDAQTSVAQVIAKNAVATLKTQGIFSSAGGAYGPYCYSFGTSSPYPNSNPAPLPTAFSSPPAGEYYWSAYVVPSSTAPTLSSAGSGGVYPGTQGNMYTIYVFVFNKGDLSNTFPTPPPPTTLLTMQPYPQNATYPDSFYPQLYSGTLAALASQTLSPAMPIGSLGVDATTGQVFREIVDPATNAITITGIPASTTSPNPYLTAHGKDIIIYAPPAIGQTSSPLVYVYVTTVSL
jgi:prepilin-type N-terminal cleavage/methylation domain-containing protein